MPDPDHEPGLSIGPGHGSEPDSDSDGREPQRGQVALVLGVVAAVLLAAAGFVVVRDLTSPDTADESVPSAPAATAPGRVETEPGGREPLPEGCRSPSASPSPLASEVAARQLCQRFGDRLRQDTRAMFDCTIDDRVEDCRPAARRAWTTLAALRQDPAYAKAQVVLTDAVALADENGRQYLGRTCTGRNDPQDETAIDCNAGYATFGLGLSTLELRLRSS
ncbi:hypothetical protein [Microlunatus parietis]|uniref:Uncharacterized protein n=1 Tax=Microlunatus parietis TaxID=682979 RepID=A0A7Y9L946_9ACTN|nr:hypothetical protein [Microlunatus parietis]NYE69182.1 hypothetical protein [Microlunatus parietis]